MLAFLEVSSIKFSEISFWAGSYWTAEPSFKGQNWFDKASTDSIAEAESQIKAESYFNIANQNSWLPSTSYPFGVLCRSNGFSIAFGVAIYIYIMPFFIHIWKTLAGRSELSCLMGSVTVARIAGLWGQSSHQNLCLLEVFWSSKITLLWALFLFSSLSLFNVDRQKVELWFPSRWWHVTSGLVLLPQLKDYVSNPNKDPKLVDSNMYTYQET